MGRPLLFNAIEHLQGDLIRETFNQIVENRVRRYQCDRKLQKSTRTCRPDDSDGLRWGKDPLVRIKPGTDQRAVIFDAKG
jgi:hypothetical protein